ncbi:hypothetical protein HY772_02110, partial [Candidatus Woesearchaeota archaeon]|nr:hypothetical protein [Candidatus Woesearchaeota archaeon]
MLLIYPAATKSLWFSILKQVFVAIAHLISLLISAQKTVTMNPYSSPPKPIDRNPSIIPIPDFSHVGFDRAKAMELANLISVAYDEYEIWDTQQQKEPPDHFIGSGVYIDLPEGIECPQGSEPPPAEKVPPGSYGRLNPLWQSAPAQVKQYQRIDKFWVTEWWWLDTFSFKNLAGLLRANLNGVGQLIGMMKDWVTDDQLFGYIDRSQQ